MKAELSSQRRTEDADFSSLGSLSLACLTHHYGSHWVQEAKLCGTKFENLCFCLVEFEFYHLQTGRDNTYLNQVCVA